jgi:hypothetical protein
MHDFKSIKTPAAMSFKKELNFARDLLNQTESKLPRLCPMIGTRSEIVFAVAELSNCVSKPCRNHLVASKERFAT